MGVRGAFFGFPNFLTLIVAGLISAVTDRAVASEICTRCWLLYKYTPDNLVIFYITW